MMSILKFRLIFLGLCFLAILPACYKQDNALPNIVIILADDLGYGDLSCLNPESKISTPNLDQLAESGMTFTDAHSGSAVCTPTRYGLLTGRYCWRTELQRSVLWPWDNPLIEKNRKTLGSILKEKGYHTACIGKWHLGWEWATTDGSSINDSLPKGVYNGNIRNPFANKIDFSKSIKNGPITRGFDYYFGDDVPNFPPYTFIENDRVVLNPDTIKPANMFGSPGPMAQGWKLDKVMPAITNKAVEYIKSFSNKSQPFFLYFPLTAPHTPIAPAEEYLGSSQAGLYGDFVQQVDATAGKIIEALKIANKIDNTLLIFTSDNGSPARNGKNMSGPVSSVLEYGHHPSFIFRGTKADIWEGGHRVPFFMYWKDKVVPGSKSEDLTCLTDLFSTIAHITGTQLEEGMAEDSHPIPALLSGDSDNFSPRKSVVNHSAGGMFAMRRGHWKLIEGQGSGGWSRGKDTSAVGQLYNLQNDISEKENLYNSHPEIVKELLDELTEIKQGN